MEFDDIRQFESDTSQGKIRFRIMDLENGALVLISGTDKFRLGLSRCSTCPNPCRESVCMDQPVMHGCCGCEYTESGIGDGIDDYPKEPSSDLMCSITSRTQLPKPSTAYT
ncbi:MAG: hypothetical protein ACXAAR_10010 [Candidatus Thorarchaeota archaeon]